MKPSQLIKKKCKTQKDQIKVLETLVDHFVGSQEAHWALEVYFSDKNKSCRKKAIN
jgi:hypothetical protein